MAKLKKKFKDDGERMGSFSPVPRGNYAAKCVKTSLHDTKSKDGKYLKCEWEILKGEYKGRKIFNNINIENPNSQAEEIAEKEIASMCDAIGIRPSKFDNSEMIHGIPIEIEVGIQDSENYGPQNTIKGYSALGKKKDDEEVETKKNKKKKKKEVEKEDQDEVKEKGKGKKKKGKKKKDKPF